jgi:CHAD domain-containing protein
MVQAAVAHDVPQRTDRARLLVPRAEDKVGHARLDDGAGAHRAGFKRDVDGAVLEPPFAAGSGGLAQGDDLGVPGRVGITLASVATGSDDVARAVDDNRAHRDVTVGQRLTRQVQCLLHIGAGALIRTHRAMVPEPCALFTLGRQNEPVFESVRKWWPVRRTDEPSSFRIPSDVDFETGFRQTVIEPATEAAELLEKYELDRGRAIHQSRKDLKKLRAALRLISEHADKKFIPAESVRLRDAGRLLAVVRDADVKVQTLASLRRRGVLPISEPVLEEWAAALERDRDELLHRLDDPHVPVGPGGAMVRSIEAVIEECRSVALWPVDGLTLRSARLALVRERARGIAAMGRVIEGGDDEAVHDFRKRIKDLWHHLDLLCDVLPELHPSHVEQAHAVSDLLGDHNDLAVLVADARARPSIVSTDDLAAMEEAVRAIERDLRDRAVEQARALYKNLI